MLSEAAIDDERALLDRPIWTSLTTRHRRFARGVGPALAFNDTVSPFAATLDDSETSLAALTRLVERDGDGVALLQATEIVTPPTLSRTRTARGVQMVAKHWIEKPARADATRLAGRDAAEMVALAHLAKPGPFAARTHLLGAFWGLRRDGRLVAMAGERLKLPGYTEISGVCVHPDHRGRGYAARLTCIVAAGIQRRGETPYLHALADNDAAIRLYRKLGFRFRTEVDIGMLERLSDSDGA